MLVSMAAVASSGGSPESEWKPMSESLKSGWSLPKAYLMAGTGFLNAESGTSKLDGYMAEAGIGLKLGKYFAVESRYMAAPSLSGDDLSGDLKAFGSGLTVYLPISHKAKAFARYDILRLTAKVEKNSVEGQIKERAQGFSVGVEGRITGKNYIRGSYQQLKGDEIEADVIEVAYLRRM